MAIQKAKIVITFNRDVAVDETLKFQRTNGVGVVIMESIFIGAYRTKNKEIPIAAPTVIAGESAAIQYERYFEIDHDNAKAKLMTFARFQNVITIEIAAPWDFTNFETTTGATAVITAYVPDTFQLLNSNLQISPTEPCRFVNVWFDCSEQADSYSLIPQSSTINITPPIPVTSNPFTVEVPRGMNLVLRVQKGSVFYDIPTIEFNVPYFYFNTLATENIITSVTPSPLVGATINVTVDYLNQPLALPNINTLQFSLDGFNWQPSGVWSGQLAGDYTAYVKDSFNCIVSKDFKVSDTLQPQNEFVEVSERNSISFSKNEIWNDDQEGVYKNPMNTLSGTELQGVLYDQYILFRKNDLVRIQFKSNYSDHNVKLYECDNDVISTNPIVEKMSQNMNLFESLDCMLTWLGNSRVGWYFNNGLTYNEQGLQIGAYELWGNLPDSAEVGNYIDLGSFGIHQIKDIIYNRDLDRKMMVFDFTIPQASDTSAVMRAYYNLLPFEVYEFDVPFDVIIKNAQKLMKVRIQFLDNLYDEQNWYSEYISVLDDQEFDNVKTVGIKYFNENNRNVFYLYGITHFLRAEILNIASTVMDETEIIKGDSSSYVSEATVHKGIKINFAEMTYRPMMKLSLALSSAKLFVNGLGYVKSEPLEIEQIPNTNLYSVSCSLLNNGKDFNTFVDERVGSINGSERLYIPRIIQSGKGYIKI